MTAGSSTKYACCCSHEVEAKCTQFQSIEECPLYVEDEPDDTYCAWPGYLYRYLSTLYPTKKFQFISYAESGINSIIAAGYIDSWIYDADLNNRDIVFIDYSVNDYEQFIHKARSTQHGMEAVIRAIIKRFAASVPNIIILEQYPHAKLELPDYPVIYRRIAEHYRLPVWSYRSGIKSGCHNLDDEYSKYFFSIGVEVQLSYGTHPATAGHLYISDIYASILGLSINKCKTNGGFVKDEIYAIPSRLYDIDPSIVSCSRDSLLLLDEEAHSTLLPSDLAKFETEEASTSGWRQYIDRHRPGWIITASSDPKQRTLMFPIDYKYQNEKDLTNYLDMVRIEYLQTYNNAGQAQVYLCNCIIGSIDALSPHHKTKHVSIPATFVVYLSSHNYYCCINIAKSDFGLQIVYEVTEDLNRGSEKVKIFSAQICVHTKQEIQ
jgi:hypothetical protein